MSWHNGLSQDEIREMIDDSRKAYSFNLISEKTFRETLAKLGYNATDIEDDVREYAPKGSDVDEDNIS